MKAPGTSIAAPGTPEPPIRYRYERKFLISELTTHEVESLVKLHPALFAQAYTPRYVNNIYFDCFALKNYCDTINGAADRVKVRIRWYGDLWPNAEKPVLEFKKKMGLLGAKESYSLPAFCLREGFTSVVFAQTVASAQLPGVVKLQFSSMQPWLINRYRRQYYLSADHNFRVTLDTDMAYYDPHCCSPPHRPRRLDALSTVLELKYAQDKDDLARDVAAAWPFRMTRNSKYINGIDSVIG